MSGLLADDDFLALDAEFAPMFARHYVITQNEAHNLAAILDAKPVGHFRLNVHVAVSMFVETIIALSPSLDRAVRHVANVILKDDGKAAELFAVGHTDIEPATHAAVVAYRSHIPDAEPFATVAARKKIARQVVGGGAKKGAPVDTLFGGFCGTLDDIAREVTGTCQRLPSKIDIDIGGNESLPVISFIRAGIEVSAGRTTRVLDAREVSEDGRKAITARLCAYRQKSDRAIAEKVWAARRSQGRLCTERAAR